MTRSLFIWMAVLGALLLLLTVWETAPGWLRGLMYIATMASAMIAGHQVRKALEQSQQDKR